MAFFNFDDPGFPYALLAILVGLRLASYVIERLLPAHSEPLTAPHQPQLAPDDPAETEQTVLPLSMNAEAPPVTSAALPATEEPPSCAEEPVCPPVETTEAAEPLLTETDEPSPTAAEPETVAADKTAKDEEQEEHGQLRLWHELLDSAIIAVVLVFFLIRPFLLQAFYIPSGSMEPTLLIGDKVLATKITFHLREPRTGDIVVFHAPPKALLTHGDAYDPKHPVDYVKRVIATPGDRVRIVNCHVYLNDKPLNEPYVANDPDGLPYDFPLDSSGNFSSEISRSIPDKHVDIINELQSHIDGEGNLVVPKGYLLVLGDNRRASHDGHKWGLLPRGAIIGKAFFIFWPPKRIGPIH